MPASDALKPAWLIVLLLFFGCTHDGDIANCKKDGGCASIVEVLRISGGLPSSANDPFWNSANSPKKNLVDLGPQLITNPQWPNPSIKKVSISAVRNDSEIALLVEWQDETENSKSTSGGEYTDQIAMMFPLQPGRDLPPITMGGEGGAVNIWQWKAVWERPPPSAASSNDIETPAVALRVSSVEDLNAEGFSTLTRQKHQDVEGNGVWENRMWRVVFKRALADSDSNDIQFRHSLPMAIAVWDGANRETNGQKGISDWIFLRLS